MPSQPLTSRGATVLLVEDHEDIRAALGEYLMAVGFRVLPVANGSRAIAALEEIQVDVVLTDFRLPDMLGTEVLEAAFTRFGLPRGAAVVVSGVHPLRGDFAFLQKPCDLEDLSRALWDRAAVGRSERKRSQWS